jgi:galactitol-specific phosphotransferase system IIB component
MVLNIGENHHAIPRAFVQAAQEAKKQIKGGQKKLDIMFQGARIPQEFSKDEVLRAVAEFVVCDDQVSDNARRDIFSS